MKIHKILSATPKSNFKLSLTFSDGTSKEIDMLPFINEGISKDLENWEYFKSVKVVDGYITWDNGYDFCPHFLYQYSPQS
jgi:hypothetical protein